MTYPKPAIQKLAEYYENEKGSCRYPKPAIKEKVIEALVLAALTDFQFDHFDLDFYISHGNGD